MLSSKRVIGRAALILSAASVIACGSSSGDDSGAGGASGGVSSGGHAGSSGNSGTAGAAGGAKGGNGGASGNAGAPAAGSSNGGEANGGTAGAASGGAAGNANGGTAGAMAGGANGGASGSAGSAAGGAAGIAGVGGGAGTTNGGASGSAGTSAGGSSGGGAGGASSGGAGGSAGTGGSGGNPSTGVSVLTRSYDNQRTNANLQETTLTPANVNSATFGKIFDLPVDDDVYAQILYAPKTAIAGGTHNVIYVATVNNSIYAFDADAPAAPLWHLNFNGTGRPTNHGDVGQACGTYNDYGGNIGSVATPVIDAATHTLYFVTRTVEGTATFQRLHAVDMSTGAERANSPAVLAGTAKTKGGAAVTFDPVVQNQRMSLSLANGAIYLGWSAFCDTGNYHGWVMAYDSTSLAQLGVFNDTPDGNQGGIWQAGAAAAFDTSGNLYLMTGNGTFDGKTNFAQSVLKLGPRTLSLADWFAPSNYDDLNNADWDLGSAGMSWLNGPNVLLGGGKEGKLYLLDPASLGHEVAGDTQVLQAFPAVDPTARPGATHHIHNSLAQWNGPAGLFVYLSGENDYLRAFHYNAAARKLDTPASLVSNVLPPEGMPGGMLTLSANGGTAHSAIVWATTPRVGDANQGIVPGVLRAYDAENLSLLWESLSPIDGTLNFAKFSNPTVVNGKVYAASFSHLITVYGLRPTPPPNLALNKTATGSAACAATEGPANAVNGSVILGNGDKWCSLAATKFLEVDLGANTLISRVVVRHANAGGEDFAMNTRDFTVQISTDHAAYSTVADITGNDTSVTTHTFAPTSARYVKLNITTPSQDGDAAARIYELEVYAQ